MARKRSTQISQNTRRETCLTLILFILFSDHFLHSFKRTEKRDAMFTAADVAKVQQRHTLLHRL